MADDLDDILDGALDDFEKLTTSADTSFPRSRSGQAASAPTESGTAAEPEPPPSSSSSVLPALAAAEPKKAPAFDPLGRKPHRARKLAGLSTSTSTAAPQPPAAPSTSQPATAATDNRSPKLPPELENLAAELAKLIAETHPDAPDPPGPASAGTGGATQAPAPPAPSMTSTAASLQALQEVRQQAVAAQGALPGPAGGGGGGGLFGGLLPDMDNLQEPGMNAIVDSIMQHLLSKEVLQQPMQEIRDCYPPWLEKNRGQIPDADMERYTKQYGFIQQICALYEQEPENYAKLVSLMQQMQACGDPPEDIVREMSAGLEHMPPGAAADGADEPPIDLQQLQQEINKCPVQ